MAEIDTKLRGLHELRSVSSLTGDDPDNAMVDGDLRVQATDLDLYDMITVER